MKLINVINAVTHLATTNRFSKSHLIKDESVLEHSGFVCLLCYFIGTSINKIDDGEVKIDIGTLLSKAIIHDIDESITGDVQRTVKYNNATTISVFKDISYEATKVIAKQTDCPFILAQWDCAKDGREGKIVGLCDAISVLYKAYDEIIIRGNKGIDFGGVKGLRMIIMNKIKDLSMSGVSYEIIDEITESCDILLSQIQIGSEYDNNS